MWLYLKRLKSSYVSSVGLNLWIWHCWEVLSGFSTMQLLCALETISVEHAAKTSWPRLGVFANVLCVRTLYAYVCILCVNVYVRACTLAPAYRHMFNAHPLAQLMRWTRSGLGGGWIVSFVRFWPPPSPFLHSLSQGRPLERANWMKYTRRLLPTPLEMSSPALMLLLGLSTTDSSQKHCNWLPAFTEERHSGHYGYAERWR